MVYEYKGNLHVHSTYSDGTGSIEKIVEAAKNTGLNFIGITDHKSLAGFHEGKENWYDDVLVLIGMEANKDFNHYLAFGISEDIEDHTENPQKTIDEVNRQGGIGFIAHPFEKGIKLVNNGKAFTWNNWDVDGFTGLCIWNYCAQWKEGINSLTKGFYCYYINRNSHVGPCKETLKKWDELLEKRHVTAIGGTDAHAFKVRIGPLRPVIFPYEYLFKTVNTHVLLKQPFTKDLERDKAQVYEALKKGSCFVAFDLYEDSTGFRFSAETHTQEACMGEEITKADIVALKVIVPKKANIKLIKNGKPVKEETGKALYHLTREPGVYRVEVQSIYPFGRTHPWIYSNPIYIK